MPRPMPDFTLLPIAHRGLHDLQAGVVENSLSAIDAAAANGYAVEIDVQLSADGEAMVFHDDVLDRLTDRTGPVGALTRAQLQHVELRGGGGDRIPSLAQALRVLAGRTPIVVEIKRQPGPSGPLEEAVARALARYSGPAAVMSFDPRPIAWFRDNAPEVRRGLVSCSFAEVDDAADVLDERQRQALADLELFDELEADFVSYGVRDLPRPAVAALRARGAPVLCWTVRNEADAAEALRHADAITFEGFRPPVAAVARGARAGRA
ncbi:glycerophosphodiester phosphodiesterase family protein [Rhodovulum sp. DZ06]|uniref:glycerophosphodiester phosphodiesterase family protein n=1 Tax=Rhodovulum sp. DZ06 TaxID=3425126 RepID=UPI003D333323